MKTSTKPTSNTAENGNKSKPLLADSGSIDIEKYRGISELEFEMTSRINQVWQRRKLVAEQMIKEDIGENQMLYAIEEIKYLDNIIKKFLFID